jgi:5-methylcytosine-specific restriction protein A
MALKQIDEEGYPDNRDAKKFVLIHEGKTYPPKYVLSIANYYANGEELNRELFSGGVEANNFLINHGFIIEEKTDAISSHSWTIINSEIASKKTDKSLFLHNGTGIPFDIREFFQLTVVQPGDRKEIILRLNDQQYKAIIETDKQKNPRTRLLWKSDLVSKIKSMFPNIVKSFEGSLQLPENTPDMVFLKTSDFEFDILFTDAIQFKAVVNDIKSDEIENEGPIKEGKIKYYYGKRYERNPKNRQRAIEFHGCSCAACMFDFEDRYGVRGKDFIEVHHLKPLFSGEGVETDIDPEKDLIPVCSNCHRMIHRDINNVLTIEELKEIISNSTKR